MNSSVALSKFNRIDWIPKWSTCLEVETFSIKNTLNASQFSIHAFGCLFHIFWFSKSLNEHKIDLIWVSEQLTWWISKVAFMSFWAIFVQHWILVDLIQFHTSERLALVDELYDTQFSLFSITCTQAPTEYIITNRLSKWQTIAQAQQNAHESFLASFQSLRKRYLWNSDHGVSIRQIGQLPWKWRVSYPTELTSHKLIANSNDENILLYCKRLCSKSDRINPKWIVGNK